MYTIRNAGVKGLGVFASTHIARGTRIFSERPLLGLTQSQSPGDVFPASLLLSLKDRTALLDLSQHTTAELTIIRWSQALWFTIRESFISLASFRRPRLAELSVREHVKILGIFRSNSFHLGETTWRLAVFGGISRINHSCVPNAQGNFHEGLGTFNVHATRDIEVDEELTLNYLPERGYMRGVRVKELSGGYGFDCECPACDLTTVIGRDGEARRVEMGRALGEFSEKVWGAQEDSIGGELLLLQSFISLLEMDGVAGRELSELYFAAAKLSGKLGEHNDALRFAKAGLEINRDCLGGDHTEYQKSAELVQNLKDKIRLD